MDSPNKEQLLEQQRLELFEDFEKEEPYLFDLYKDIYSMVIFDRTKELV